MTGPGLALIEGELATHGITLDAVQCDRLARYAALLLHWNRRINLVGTRDPRILWRRHLLDCLMLETVPRRPALHRWLDVGSGAGLPGIVLAIVHPEYHVTTVDSVARKATFLAEATRQLGLPNVTCIRDDARRLATQPGFMPFDALVARAFGPLATLLELGVSLLQPSGEVWAMKGRRWQTEASGLSPALQRAYLAPPQVHPYCLAATPEPTGTADAEAVVLIYRRPSAPPTAA